jgi:hypothetical protein
MLNRISELWCRAMHKQAMWPMHGKYICPQCLREYPTHWEAPLPPAGYPHAARREQELAMPAPLTIVQ